jgi:hypothetical protein
MILILASVHFYLKDGNNNFLISGFFLGASIAVRPLGWALLAAYVINYFWIDKERLKKAKEVLILTSGVVSFIALFGFIIYLNFGRFVFTSTNGPLNLLIGANKDATGAFNSRVFEKGNSGYIEHPERMTYTEKGDYWLKQTENYIKLNPVKWISLFPMKIVYMFIWDDFSVYKLLNFDDWNLYRVTKNILSKDNNETLMDNKPLSLKISFFVLEILHHIYYFSILILFLYIFKANYKIIFKNNYTRLFLLFIITGILINLLTYGDARYKYPYIICAIIIIAPVVSQFKNDLKMNFKIKTPG